MAASEEDDTSEGEFFINQVFMALNKGCNSFGSPIDCSFPWYDVAQGLDIDEDGLVSFAEAFRKAYEKRLDSDDPVYDDNGDLEESYGNTLTFVHELPTCAPLSRPDGILGDTLVLNAEFFGNINGVPCFDYDLPLDFDTLRGVTVYGTSYLDYAEPGIVVDYGCDGASAKSWTRCLCDLDGDGSIDNTDFLRFQSCSSGPGIPQANPSCGQADFDLDGDVDQSDFGVLQRWLGF
jgi:hypothetical protein